MADRYQIIFDMDTKLLEELYHGNSDNNAYTDIRSVLNRYGFKNIQGSVYNGDEGVSEAHGTMAIQELTAKYSWFNPCISNIKFYRLESELNAQFISDAVHAARLKFQKQLDNLKSQLIEAGVPEDKIQAILKDQTFEYEGLENQKLIMPGKK